MAAMDNGKDILEMDIEDSLENLEEHDNATQLDLLSKEIEHIMEHGIQPPQEWFELRFQKVYIYSELEWALFANRFRNKNDYIFETCYKITQMIESIMNEWSVSPVFSLSTYYHLLYEMDNLWQYYSTGYMDENMDDDITDLISGIKHL
jgi:hypothetical protein